MTLSELNNPRKITGFLAWNNGRQKEYTTDEQTAIQETDGRIEIWQQHSEETILKAQGWNKKNVTHVVINGQFVAI